MAVACRGANGAMALGGIHGMRTSKEEKL